MKSALILHIAVVLVFPLLAVAAAEQRPMTVDDLFRFKRVGDPQISPDGKQVVYVVTTRRPATATRSSSNLWLAADRRQGAAAAAHHRPSKKDRHPRWTPGRQAHPLRVEPLRRQPALGHRPGRRRGPAAHRRISTGAANGIWSPDGKHDRLRLGRLSRVLRQAVRGERRAQQEEAWRRSRRARSRRRSSRGSSTATGTSTSRTSGSTCSSCRSTTARPASRSDVTPGDRDAYPTSTTFSVGDDFTLQPRRQVPGLHRRAGEGRGVEHQLRPLPRAGRPAARRSGRR